MTSERPTSKSGGGSSRPGGKPASGKPRSDKPRSDKPRSDKQRTDKPRGPKPGADKPRSDKPGGYPPRAGKPGTDRPRSSGRPSADRSGGDRSRTDTRRSTRPADDRPRDPEIPEDVSLDELDKGVGHELRTLPEGLAEVVGRHLVAADRALVDDDVPLARAHIAAAKRRAGRVAAVREAAGITAYLAGDYVEAAAELRTVRRMTGSNAYVPMLADCERGLGRPQRALEIIREVDARSLDQQTRIELLLVAAGARADLGQVEAALVMLQVPELTGLPKGTEKARLQYAYADLLEQAGRREESREWMTRAASSDIEGVTDAEERLEEAAGVTFIEEELSDED